MKVELSVEEIDRAMAWYEYIESTNEMTQQDHHIYNLLLQSLKDSPLRVVELKEINQCLTKLIS